VLAADAGYRHRVERVSYKTGATFVVDGGITAAWVTPE
jgi:hypothetical protein